MSGLDHGPQPVVSACDIARPRAALDEARVPEEDLGFRVFSGTSGLECKERRRFQHPGFPGFDHMQVLQPVTASSLKSRNCNQHRQQHDSFPAGGLFVNKRRTGWPLYSNDKEGVNIKINRKTMIKHLGP